MKVIETERLILRTWKEEDAKAYFQFNQDLKVLEFLGAAPLMQEVKDFISEMSAQFERLRFTLFAAEEKHSGKFIGYIGLNIPKWESHFTPCND